MNIKKTDFKHISPEAYEDAIKSFLTEVDFQKHLIADQRPDMIVRPQMAVPLLAMQENLRKAVEAWYLDSEENSYADTLEYVRKVVGLALQASEQFPIPERNIPQK